MLMSFADDEETSSSPSPISSPQARLAKPGGDKCDFPIGGGIGVCRPDVGPQGSRHGLGYRWPRAGRGERRGGGGRLEGTRVNGVEGCGREGGGGGGWGRAGMGG